MTRACATVAVLVLGCCAASSSLRSRTTPKPADAHTELWEEAFRLAPDGARSHRVRHRTTLHTEFAIDDLGDPRIVHNTALEELTVRHSETTMRDGTKVAIAPNSVNETTPSDLAAAPAYADVRETVVTHVGLEVGCTSDFEYEVTAEGEEPLSLVIPVHRAYTVGKRVVQVTVPDDRELAWECLACTVHPDAVAENGLRTVRFAWNDLPAFNTAEANGPGLAPGQPRLVVSTTASWGQLADALLERFARAARTTDDVRARALALVGELATAEQRIDELWRYVTEEIRTVQCNLADLRFEPSEAAAVLDRSYGHSLDKAVLLTALLASLDIPARPVLLSRDSLFAREVPALPQLAEVWLVVDAGAGDRWLSTEDRLPGDGLAYLAGRSALDLEAGMAFEIVPPIDAAVENHARLVAEIEVAGDGTTSAEMTITLTGTYSPYYAAQKSGSATVARQLVPDGWSADCDGCYARAHHLAPAMSTFAVRAERPPTGAGRVVEVDLPWVPGSQLLGADIHRQTKMTSTALRSLGMESVHLEVRAADSLVPTTELPTPFLANSAGKLIGERETRDGTLVADTTLTIERRILGSEDYLSLRDLVAELHRAAGRSLLYVRAR